MAAARHSREKYGLETNYSNPFISLTSVSEGAASIREANRDRAVTKCEHMNPFLCAESCANTHANGECVFAPPDGPARPQFSRTNPFVDAECRSYGRERNTGSSMNYYPAPTPQMKIHYPDSNPFSSAHMDSFVHSTPAQFNAMLNTPMQCMPSSSLNEAISYGEITAQHKPRSKPGKTRCVPRQPLSDSEEDGDTRERVPTLRPGQYDGTTPWKEFLHRFESCAEANYWSEKTMTTQLKFCLVGAAGAIIHRNPRSSKWDYRRLVDELETAYGPSSDHAAAVAVELRQRVRKPGEALHVFRDDIYGKVAVAYGNRAEIEQDSIAVEVFTNGLGDAEIVQKLLERHPATLACAYEIAHRHETTKRAASYVTSAMQQGARNAAERRPRAAVVREKDRDETVAEHAPAASPSPNRFVPHTPSTTPNNHRNFKRSGVRCHNCQGWGHVQKQCPSPHKTTKALTLNNSPWDSPKPTVLHLKCQSQEMSIPMRLYEVEVCAVLDSGARRSVLPLPYYNSIHPDVRPPLQPSVVETLLGVGPGDVPVLGEAQIPVNINNRQVDVDFLVADIAGNEVLLGHPFLTQAEARLDFGKRRIILFGEEVLYYQTEASTKSHAVRIARTVVVEPGQEYMVKGNVHPGAAARGDMMLSPTKGFVEKHKVLIARVLVNAQPSKAVPLRLFNLGNKAVTIKAGSIAGLLQPAEAVEPSMVSPAADSLTSPPVVPLHLQELYAQSSTDLNDYEQLQLKRLLCTYGHVFSTGPADLGRTSLVQHDIITRPGAPVKQNPRRMAGEKQQNADQQIYDSLQSGLAQRSCSSWASPIVMVRKKDGTYRLCIDYRALNDRTITDAYPLPRIQDTLDTLSTARWFSTLDLASGYWQVELTPRARRAAAFCTRTGLFEWNVMPFGLCNAPATFQRLMDRVLAGMQWETCLVYLDDIIVLAKDVSGMLQRLGQVFYRLQQANLKLKPAKCCLFRREVAYLGHVVSEHGVATDPSKVQKVQMWPTPTSIQEVRRFIGLASYYRRFVKDFASIAEPLHNLTKKNAHFQWHAEHQAAFDKLKCRLTSAPVLRYPLDHGEMTLDTDASDTGIGAVLSQMQQGVERVLAYGSRKLSRTEQNYCTTRRELLAVVDFTSHFRQYLLGRPFKVRTDHSSLRWLTKMKEPEGQLARWLEKLAEYNFEIIHRPGRVHTNADSLSRRPCRQSCPCRVQDPPKHLGGTSHQAVQCELDSDTSSLLLSPVRVEGQPATTAVCLVGVSHNTTTPETKTLDQTALTKSDILCQNTPINTDISEQTIHTRTDISHQNMSTNTHTVKLTEKVYVAKTLDTASLFHGWTMGELSQAQDADADIAPIRAWMEASSERPPWTIVSPCSPATKTYWAQWKRLYFRDGVLVRRFYCLDETQFYPQIVLPRKLQPEVMGQMHEGPVGGHFGVERTVARLRTRFYWYHMREDVALWCRTCTSCASRARPQKTPQAPMGTVRVGAPMERVALDIMGPLNETERRNRYVLVIQDYFTKWTEAFPIPDERAATVAEVVASEWVCRYGIPQALHSDQGRNFESDVFQGVCSLFGIDKTHTTPFRPQSDGQVERFNATLQKILASTAERCHWDWDLMIPYAVMAYRATKHSATGFTPNFMMFGRELSEPVDLVAGLPPDPGNQPSVPEYVQQMRERLELAHLIAREALGESVKRAKRQYDKNCCHTQYKTGDPVWYLIKGTRHVKNKVRKFLPSYEGPFFVLGQLDDLVYRIQKNPRSKVKVVHHDQLKHYRCREPLDNTWVLDQAHQWSPTEVPPPALEDDPADRDLGLHSLFSTATGNGPSSSQPSVSVAADPALVVVVPSSPSHVDHENGGGVVGEPDHPGQQFQRPTRRRRAPDRSEGS
ncbi:uncharacterized protein LOC113021785 [Astatotilapia calliptera]|uniref:uncharacterized protein LOC113021785 n=1 Tax=Astatotilapia calliptera TaxID=8154 RepID=UPI000E427A0C|nr:uncharacterized protein LOC113021785 [Astatotilapia calliptera]